jgi:hypothetical protein
MQLREKIDGKEMTISELETLLTSLVPKGMKIYSERNRYSDYSQITYHRADNGFRSYSNRSIREKVAMDIYINSTYVYLETKSAVEPADWYVRANGQEALDKLRAGVKRFNRMMFEYWQNANGINPHVKETKHETRQQRGEHKHRVHRSNYHNSFEAYYNNLSSAKSVDETQVIASLPKITGSASSSRTWGIEIEVAGARGVRAPVGWERKEDGSLRSAYTSAPDDDDFECSCAASGYDCEYCEDYDSHYECGECRNDEDSEDTAEFVSDILQDVYEGGIDDLCEAVRFEPQNSTAGIHIHVGAKDLTPKQIGAVLYAYGLIEPMIDASYQREEREYCKPLTGSWVKYGLQSAKTVKRYQDVDMGERYLSVNVNSLSVHGTIEFRAMGPVYDADYLHKWALFCREMVNVAKNNVPIKRWEAVKEFADVLAIFAEYGEEVPGMDYAEAIEDSKKQSEGARKVREERAKEAARWAAENDAKRQAEREAQMANIEARVIARTTESISELTVVAREIASSASSGTIDWAMTVPEPIRSAYTYDF